MESSQNSPAPVSSLNLSPLVGLLAALLIANLVSAFILFKLLPKAEVTVIPKWEYKCESVSDASFSSEMNTLGDEGWEVVAARRAQGSDEVMKYEMILKRPKPKK